MEHHPDFQASDEMASCPWCKSIESLSLAGDGLGGVTVRCTACGCKGPAASIGDDFEAADDAAVARWTNRPKDFAWRDREILDRLDDSVRLYVLLYEEPMENSTVSVPYHDLKRLLDFAKASAG